jgi:hypothetical protein
MPVSFPNPTREALGGKQFPTRVRFGPVCSSAERLEVLDPRTAEHRPVRFVGIEDR